MELIIHRQHAARPSAAEFLRHAIGRSFKIRHFGARETAQNLRLVNGRAACNSGMRRTHRQSELCASVAGLLFALVEKNLLTQVISDDPLKELVSFSRLLIEYTISTDGGPGDKSMIYLNFNVELHPCGAFGTKSKVLRD